MMGGYRPNKAETIRHSVIKLCIEPKHLVDMAGVQQSQPRWSLNHTPCCTMNIAMPIGLITVRSYLKN